VELAGVDAVDTWPQIPQPRPHTFQTAELRSDRRIRPQQRRDDGGVDPVEKVVFLNQPGHDALAITVEGAENVGSVEKAVRRLAEADASSMEPQVEAAALDGLKFSECLPKELALATLASRLGDQSAARAVLSQPLGVVSGVGVTRS